MSTTRGPREPARKRVARGAWYAVVGVSGFYVHLLGWLLVLAAVPALAGWQPFAIVSDSMRPHIAAGDVVVASPIDADTIEPGHVAVFENSRGHTVTHRVAEVNGDLVRTRGDANGELDADPVPVADVHGVGRVLVPMVALPWAWMHNGETGVAALWAAVTLLAAAVAYVPEALMPSSAVAQPARQPARTAGPRGVGAGLRTWVRRLPPASDPGTVPARAAPLLARVTTMAGLLAVAAAAVLVVGDTARASIAAAQPSAASFHAAESFEPSVESFSVSDVDAGTQTVSMELPQPLDEADVVTVDLSDAQRAGAADYTQASVSTGSLVVDDQGASEDTVVDVVVGDGAQVGGQVTVTVSGVAEGGERVSGLEATAVRSDAPGSPVGDTFAAGDGDGIDEVFGMVAGDLTAGQGEQTFSFTFAEDMPVGTEVTIYLGDASQQGVEYPNPGQAQTSANVGDTDYAGGGGHGGGGEATITWEATDPVPAGTQVDVVLGGISGAEPGMLLPATFELGGVSETVVFEVE